MSAAPAAAKPSTIKKDSKKILKGVIVKKIKKRTKPAVSPSVSDTESKSTKSKQVTVDDNTSPDAKRRKIDGS